MGVVKLGGITSAVTGHGQLVSIGIRAASRVPVHGMVTAATIGAGTTLPSRKTYKYIGPRLDRATSTAHPSATRDLGSFVLMSVGETTY